MGRRLPEVCLRTPRRALHPSEHRPAFPTLLWSEVEILEATLTAAMSHRCFGGNGSGLFGDLREDRVTVLAERLRSESLRTAAHV